MNIALAEAQACLSELVARAEAGDEVVLTRDGRPAVRLVPVPAEKLSVPDREARRRILEEFQKAASAKVTPGPNAARSQDFLYDEFGIPA